MARKTATATEPDTNGRLEQRFGIELPYTMTIRLRGVTPFLFNRMDIDAYAQEGPGGKRKPRAQRDYESMVWRDDDGNLAYPVRSFVASILEAGKFYKSPIANNGSARNTLRDALVPSEAHGTFGVTTWDAIDFRKCNHSDVKRSPKPTYRPRLEIGWSYVGTFGVVLPELYGPAKVLEIASRAGMVLGMGDGRKIGFGRSVLDGHEIAEGLPW